MMSISLQITDSVKQIEQRVNKAIADLANELLSNNLPSIHGSIKSLIPSWINSQPEIGSLLSSDPMSLAGQFGIKDSTLNIVNSIINSVVNATEIKLIRYSSSLRGGLEINFQPANFSNLLSLSEGHSIYNGGDLHWLDWLLKRGDSIIVMNYQYNPKTGLGRSGLGNMVPGNSFRVPPQFSGTENDNFITRAFLGQDQEKQIAKILQDVLEK
jgi:hypothetical protein